MHFSRLNAPIYEFACHEGNYALTNMLRGKRLEELRRKGMLAETGSAWHREVQSFLDQFHDRVACALLDVRELEQGGTEEMSVGVHI